MASRRSIVISLIVAGSLACLLTSCGDEGVTEPQCVNCDFWSQPFSRMARFPTLSPADPNLIAYSSTADTTGQCTEPKRSHIWVARRPEIPGEDTRFYQITCSDYDDFGPAWSPDGDLIVFERRFEAGGSDVLVVDVSDLENPTLPVQFTDRDSLPESNGSPGWAVIGGTTYIVFCNSKSGGNDVDIAMYRYPDRGPVIWLTDDPYDRAEADAKKADPRNFTRYMVLSAIFKDEHVCANGSNLVAFSSPDRLKVCDIEVLARSRETDPDATAHARVSVNGKDSGLYTPYVFRGRPASDLGVAVEGALTGYCTNATGALQTVPDALNTMVLEFQYYHGTVGFSSDPGVKYVFYDGRRLEGIRTPGSAGEYVFVPCMALGRHVAYAANTRDEVQCSPVVEFTVLAGQTTLVDFDCTECVVAGSPVPSSPAVDEAPAQEVKAVSSLPLPNGVWLIDTRDQASAADDTTYHVMSSASPVLQPALSPDGKYVAYIVGEGRGRRIFVSDLSGLLAGGQVGEPLVVGLPGSLDYTECWRMVEQVEWFPSTTERKLMVSLSKCRQGAVGEDFEPWVADLSSFLD